MRRKSSSLWKTLIAIATFGISQSFAQLAPNIYYVQFKDKKNSTFSINNPTAFLSQRAIDRRNKQGIPITEQDLPVNKNYIDSVLSKGAIQLKYPLKWFNGIVIQSKDTPAIQKIWTLPFVDVANSVKKRSSSVKRKNKEIEEEVFPISYQAGRRSTSALNYGAAANQATMISVDKLHDEGFTGSGMLIAVMDAGFTGADTLKAFKNLWDNNKIKAERDFVEGGKLKYNRSRHGMNVLSTMGGNLPGKIVGTAPDADYILLRTENGFSEYLVEEYNWVAGAEFADSLGADVFNTSLGYTTFNEPSQNHAYKDMNGDRTPITKGADIAAGKGILVINSAGNSGGSPWHYIGAPADGDSVLAIGAVAGNRAIASFSSRGPSFDGRVKPNVCAQGEGTAVYTTGDIVVGSNGTSFSGPVLAGAAACLWQANKNAKSMEIFNAIQKSADRYSYPNADYGYGIPNMFMARHIMTNVNEVKSSNKWSVYPNPFNDVFSVLMPSGTGSNTRIAVYDINGRLVYESAREAVDGIIDVNSMGWEKGVYFIKVSGLGVEFTEKLIKL